MTSRERVLAALAHQEPDRVPVDLGATEASGIMALAYNRLKRHFGLEGGRLQIPGVGQMLAKVEAPVLERVGADALPLLLEPRQWKPWILADGSTAEIPAKVNIARLPSGETVILAADGTEVAHCPKDGFYFDTVVHPLDRATTVDDIDAGAAHFRSFDWPAHFDEDYDDLRAKARKLRQETPYAIVANLVLHLFSAGQVLRGFENFMVDLMVDKPLAHRLLERQVEAYWPRVERYFEAVGDYVDLVMVTDDLGTQNGPQLSPELYREMVKPYHKKLWGHIKAKSRKPLLLHSCGSIYRLLPDLIEIGVDALNPIQVSATDMDTRRLKREFGRDLVFWGGGCDTQTVLARGTPGQVREEVRRRVDDLAPGGGFVFCQVHNIQADVPVENILAMYEELGTLS